MNAPPLQILDVFSGIGGISLGLERAGMRTVAFCEIEKYCRAVLRKRWPDVPIYGDIRKLDARRLARDGIRCDGIVGGFPCQDISSAGTGFGIEGERSGLWIEFARLVCELRPRFALMENVSALLYRGLGDILGELAALGYDAEWNCVPASYVGAPHRRDRIWIVAFASDADGGRCEERGQSQHGSEPSAFRNQSDGCGPEGFRTGPLPDAIGERLERQLEGGTEARPAHRPGHADYSAGWAIEPDVCRVANGIPARVDRIRALGNAVVPQVVEMIGHAINARLRAP